MVWLYISTGYTYGFGADPSLAETMIKAHTTPQSDRVFTIPVKFLQTEAYTDLGPALILWLRLVIQQQTRKRKVRETDAVLADWLNTSRRTILQYKRSLMDLGYLNIDTSTRPQQVSVRFFPKS